MNRVRLKELALVAVAGSLLAFEAVGLRGALAPAMRSLAGEGPLDAVKVASRRAVLATASALDDAGASAAVVAVDAAKRAARLLGTVTLPRHGSRHALEPAHTQGASRHAHVCVITVTDRAVRVVGPACRSARRLHVVHRGVGGMTRASTL